MLKLFKRKTTDKAKVALLDIYLNPKNERKMIEHAAEESIKEQNALLGRYRELVKER